MLFRLSNTNNPSISSNMRQNSLVSQLWWFISFFCLISSPVSNRYLSPSNPLSTNFSSLVFKHYIKASISPMATSLRFKLGSSLLGALLNTYATSICTWCVSSFNILKHCWNTPRSYTISVCYTVPAVKLLTVQAASLRVFSFPEASILQMYLIPSVFMTKSVISSVAVAKLPKILTVGDSRCPKFKFRISQSLLTINSPLLPNMYSMWSLSPSEM